MEPGKFITLEGGEGVGKSSNVEFIAQYIIEAGKSVVTTREPGGTDLGERIRGLLLDVNGDVISQRAELLLIFAARAQHLETLILPAIKAGQWVVCDRFTDASYAYQGGGRGIANEEIKFLEQWVQQSYTPDLTLLLDAPVEIGLGRAGKRGSLDRFEREENDFFERVRNHYLNLARQFPNRIKRVNASQPLHVVQREIVLYLDQFLQN